MTAAIALRLDVYHVTSSARSMIMLKEILWKTYNARPARKNIQQEDVTLTLCVNCDHYKWNIKPHLHHKLNGTARLILFTAQ